MATPPFHYQHMFPLGPDKTEYYLLTKDYVSVSEFEGKPILKIEKEGLTAMANAAFRDVSFLLRRSHNEQVAKILSDPEASDNDKYVALTFLRNAEVSAKGKLPLCQDTGTAIIHGEKGQQVWTGYCDEEALSLGVYKTYTEENLRYSQNAPCVMQKFQLKVNYLFVKIRVLLLSMVRKVSRYGPAIVMKKPFPWEFIRLIRKKIFVILRMLL